MKRTREWPKAANALSAQLMRAAPGLRETGIDIQRGRSHGRTFFALGEMKKVPAKDRHHPHPGPIFEEKTSNLSMLPGADRGADGGADGADGVDGIGTPAREENPPGNNELASSGADGADGADDLQPLSTSRPEQDLGAGEVEWSE